MNKDELAVDKKQALKEIRIIIALLEIVISIFWIWSNLSLLYDYKMRPHVLRIVKFPEWELWVLSIIGLLGLLNGAYLWLNPKYKLSKSLIFMCLLFGLIFILTLI